MCCLACDTADVLTAFVWCERIEAHRAKLPIARLILGGNFVTTGFMV